MYCEETRGQLLDYLDNDLPYSLQSEMEEHLADCIQCRKDLAEFKAASRLMQLRSVPDPGEGYWDRTWETLQTKFPAKIVAMPDKARSDENVAETPVAPRWLNKRFAMFVAAAAVLLVAVTGAGWYVYEENNYVDNDIEFEIVTEQPWEPTLIDFRSEDRFPADNAFSAYSRAAVGGIDPVSKGAILMKAETASK